MVNLRHRSLVTEVNTKHPSHAVQLVLPRRPGYGTIKMSSHTGDGVAESCQQWPCQGGIGHGAMLALSQAGDGLAESALVVA
jgi:hypothetical protein